MGNTFNVSWPANYLGSRLQIQTNPALVGLGSNWVDVTGSTQSNAFVAPINPSLGSVFFRLVYP